MNIKRNKDNSWIIKSVFALFAFALLAFNCSDLMRGVRSLPGAYYAESDGELYEMLSCIGCPDGVTVTASASGDERISERRFDVQYKLLGVIPIKSASAFVGERAYLAPCGQPVGISIFTEGVLVVGLAGFQNEAGSQVSPAAEAGLRAGDIILYADGREVNSSAVLQSIIDKSDGGTELIVTRSGKQLAVRVFPQVSAQSGGKRIGAWIRDSTVGVGTLSFYDEKTGVIAALGHSVTDPDTGTLLTVKDGKLVLARIIGVTRGMQGSPGELQGTFDDRSPVVGTVSANTELGIYGYADADAELFSGLQPVAVAYPDEVHTGEALLYADVDGSGVKAYACRIVKTDSQNEPGQKGLVIEVTDSELIGKTGGIVQGMSGSPVMQDGMLVGVLTHVFVNDPHKGYGAYAYWMYKTFMEKP